MSASVVRPTTAGHPAPALLLIGCLLAPAGGAADTVHFTDERTGVDGWKFEGEGIRVQWIQRLPDQTRAFFLGRGFTSAAADRLAGQCLFQTIVHNTRAPGGGAVTVDLHEWSTLQGSQRQPMLLKAHWQQIWARLDVSPKARTAFQWSFFPTTQEFAPGDWNMGMTSYPVAPGEPLSLDIVWHTDGRRHQARIDGPVCGTNEMAAEFTK